MKDSTKEFIDGISSMCGPGDEWISRYGFLLFVVSFFIVAWQFILKIKHAETKSDFIMYFVYSFATPFAAACIAVMGVMFTPIAVLAGIGHLIYKMVKPVSHNRRRLKAIT